MDFSEKISNILRTNKLGLATNEALSEFCGFHKDTIRKAIERGTSLNKSYTRILTDKIGINPDWWDTGKGDVYVKNGTQDGEIRTKNEKELTVKNQLLRKGSETADEVILFLLDKIKKYEDKYGPL